MLYICTCVLDLVFLLSTDFFQNYSSIINSWKFYVAVFHLEIKLLAIKLYSLRTLNFIYYILYRSFCNINPEQILGILSVCKWTPVKSNNLVLLLKYSSFQVTNLEFISQVPTLLMFELFLHLFYTTSNVTFFDFLED